MHYLRHVHLAIFCAFQLFFYLATRLALSGTPYVVYPVFYQYMCVALYFVWVVVSFLLYRYFTWALRYLERRQERERECIEDIKRRVADMKRHAA